MFATQKPLVPINITAEWLFAETEMRRPRCWIYKNYFYMREKEDFPNGPIRKYRFLGRNTASFTFRIVAVK